MKRIAVLLGLVVLTAPLWAQIGANLRWTNPTAYQDGTVLPIGDIRETRLHFGQSQGGPYTFATEVVAGQATEYSTLPMFGQGQWYAVATTVVVTGLESEYSNEASFLVDRCQANPAGCRPNPPTNLTIQ